LNPSGTPDADSSPSLGSAGAVPSPVIALPAARSSRSYSRFGL